MSIPGAVMPGAPAPAPGGADGAPMGGGGPEDILKMLASFQGQPSPDAEKKMLQDAVVMISGAYPKIQLRSAKAARLVSEAQAKVQSAIEALATEGQQPVAAPPNLGLGAGAPPGGPGMGM
jgi:hypothetical protein